MHVAVLLFSCISGLQLQFDSVLSEVFVSFHEAALADEEAEYSSGTVTTYCCNFLPSSSEI
jgi:hypothetical protein